MEKYLFPAVKAFVFFSVLGFEDVPVKFSCDLIVF